MMRAMMFGAGQNQFATGWAKAASNVCEVVGVTASPDGLQPIPGLRGVGRGERDGITVLGVDFGPRLQKPSHVAS